MANKPVLGMAGALLSAVVVSGCESGRAFFDGARSYMPPPAPASTAYAQPTQWNNQPRLMAANGPAGLLNASAVRTESVPMYNATAMKADGSPGPVEVTSSLQLVNGVNGAPGATPMLTITLPAVKFLVPINGTYSFTPPPGGTGAPAASADTTAANHGGGATGTTSMDNPLLRAGTPAPSTTVQYTPPTIQYVVPTSPNTAPSVQYTVPQGQPAAPIIQYSAPQPPGPLPSPAAHPQQPMTSTIPYLPAPGPKMVDDTVAAPKPNLLAPPPGPKMVDDTVAAPKPNLLAPPPPTWPSSAGETVDSPMSENMAVPPPPPPIHRHSAGGSVSGPPSS